MLLTTYEIPHIKSHGYQLYSCKAGLPHDFSLEKIWRSVDIFSVLSFVLQGF